MEEENKPKPGFRRETFNVGNKIFNEGDDGDAVYLLVSGEVELYRRDGLHSKTLATLKKGDIFGEMALLNNSPRGATAVVTDSCEVVVVPKETFEQHLSKVHPVIRSVMQCLTKRVLKN